MTSPRSWAESQHRLTTVVFYSAALAHGEVAKRAAFAALVGQLAVRWPSNEGSAVLPATGTAPAPGGFVLLENGHRLFVHTDPHRTCHWMRHITAPDLQ